MPPERGDMIKKIIIPILALSIALTACGNPSAGSGVPEFFRDVDTVSVGEGYGFGNGYTVAIKKDGTLLAWGDNWWGQLGRGNTLPTGIPKQIGSDAHWKAVSAGSGYTVAIKKDDTIWAWGYNNLGQLGDGTTSDSSIPVQVGNNTDDWKAVSAGYEHTVAIKKDDTLWAWGSNYYGQLGDGTTSDSSIPVQVIISGIPGAVNDDWIAVSTGGGYTVAIKKGGTIWAWGDNQYGQLGNGESGSSIPVQVGNNTDDWKTVSAGYYHAVAIKNNGELWAWGLNDFGQLGDGTTSNRRAPVRVGTGWKSVFVGNSHTAAIKENGELWAWGWNYFGQLGDATTTDRSTPVKIGDRWKAVSAGNNYTVAIREDSVLWAWGYNEFGQLGDATTTDRPTPVRVILSGW